MSAQENPPVRVQAIYSFKGKNNDELCFKKGDIITITQFEEGGWWEGTLDEKTGWFPSSYVKEVQGEIPVSKDVTAAQQKAFRTMVIKDFIESEKAHIAELRSFSSGYLTQIEQSNILSKEEYRDLVSNLSDVISVSESLLLGLETSRRVGRHLLSIVPQLKNVLTSYCASHPHSVAVINKHKAALESMLEASSMNFLGLTSGLSKPFRRLDKYLATLQELERHTDESNPDRGDTQRATALFKEIATSCAAVRRQKELEVEIVAGGIRGWEGAPLTALGPVLHVGSVAVGPQHADRYLVLFASTLLVLSVSPRVSAFIYEGKLPLAGIKVVKLEDSETYKNAFEISGPLIDTIVAVCQSKEDQTKWVNIISQHSSTLGAKPPPHSNSNKNSSSDEVDCASGSGWRVVRLRPSAPDTSTLRNKSQEITKVQESSKGFEEEAQILQVIEAYCSSSRYTINSGYIRIKK